MNSRQNGLQRGYIWVVAPLPEKYFLNSHSFADAAIRGAHKFQLDLGRSLPTELSQQEYQEWRQLWLTIISFDR
jgi:hypothetical protein